ncbi:MAG: hypothetical protein UT05_C0005G0011 [Parcubacteria group bacterium GW2011_GWF2_38_76]|nr:MAG: hypothetical protein UT05_C0005G0011 [Parcubacteria group bacterium GW2011_GWF2_38_76]HBM45581.1 hypothetical protein [Patescibacteria group bacterium]
MKIKTAKQKNCADCGPTSLKMLSDYFNLGYSYKELAKMSNYTREEGMTTDKMIRTIEKMGLRVQAKHGNSWDNLNNKNTPENVIILLWMYNGYIEHYSVLEKVTEKRIYYADPYLGKIDWAKKHFFLKMWHNYKDFKYPTKSSDMQLRWMAVVSKK